METHHRLLSFEPLECRDLLAVRFFISPGSDPSGDLEFQAALQLPFTELDFDLDYPPDGIRCGDRIDYLGQDTWINRLATVCDAVTPEHYQLRGLDCPPIDFPESCDYGEYGTVHRHALTRFAGDHLRITFSYPNSSDVKPKEGIGMWVLDGFHHPWHDQDQLNDTHYRMWVQETDGSEHLSSPLDSGRDGLVVEGFIGAVSDIGLTRIEVRIYNPPTLLHNWGVDHVQIGSPVVRADIAVRGLTIENDRVVATWEVTDRELPTGAFVGLYWSDNASFRLERDGGNLAHAAGTVQEVGSYINTVAMRDLQGQPRDFLLLVVNPFDDLPAEPRENNSATIRWPPDCYLGQALSSINLVGRHLGSFVPKGFGMSFAVSDTTADFRVVSEYNAFSSECMAVGDFSHSVIIGVSTDILPIVPILPFAEISGQIRITRRSGFVDWDVNLLTVTILGLEPANIPFTTSLGTVVRTPDELGLSAGATFKEVVSAAVIEPHAELLEVSGLLSLIDGLLLFDPGETDVLVTDGDGRRTGISHDGLTYREIPHSFHAKIDGFPLVFVASPETGTYETQIIGRSTGAYEFIAVLLQDSQLIAEQSFAGQIVAGGVVLASSTIDGIDLWTEVYRSGDFDRDGIVSQADLDLVLTNWGRPADQPPTNWINDLPSGLIDQNELDAVLTNWGNRAETAAFAALPSPAAANLSFERSATMMKLHGATRHANGESPKYRDPNPLSSNITSELLADVLFGAPRK
jgi:hypothetical protein